MELTNEKVEQQSTDGIAKHTPMVDSGTENIATERERVSVCGMGHRSA